MMKAVLICALAAMAAPAVAQDALVTREILQEKPLSGVDGMVVILSRLVIEPGGRIPLHTHAGDEHAMVLHGGQVLLPNGKEAAFAEGMTLFFEAGSVHGGVTNKSAAPMTLLTTHVVKAGEPFQTLAD
ncbi:cupin domain-containing protein [Primorskyibacter sp. 2E107]|uniref:cupin domain-containing protein n=1 Tax=Primorskyibacter sp. 2E107 TaxID=3403458 RepID=UPI003AF65476